MPSIGYTASVYRNEAAIGSSLKRIFEQNLVPGLTRQDIFLTSKLAVTESLRNLQVDYIDLYLIHWPGDAFSAPTPTIARTMVIPHVHQFEMHPRHFQKPLVDYCQHHRIQVQAYSSLGESRLVSLTPPPPPAMDSNYNTAPLPGPLDIMPDLIRKYFPVPALATANNASIDATADGLVGATTEMEYPKRAAQILLRWGLQHGAVVIPKSTHPERIRNNIDLFSFEIDAQDMAALDAYSLEGERTRYCWDSTEVF
ncbi:hypothetical protein BGX24_000636 [Mortierella sp. AD032]|nr:hypothetical protein BGX24_000636 [Mortierella sp. AD032]